MSSTSAPLLPNATIVDRSDLTESIACFRIRSDAAPVAFVPGQYVTVGLGVDERLVQRPYSIASSARRLDDGSLRRLESVQNALEQGRSAAVALLGRERPFNATPWFWSDQYDVKLQMLGLGASFDQVVTRGDPASRKFSWYYFKAGKLIAIDSLNQPGDHMTGRKLFDKGISPTPAQAADTGLDLAALLA